MNKFFIIPSDYDIWNQRELEKFLIDNQGLDIELNINEGCDCEQIGLFNTLDLFEFKSVNIKTCNFIQESQQYNIILNNEKFKFFELISSDVEQYYQYHTWNQTKTFLILYNRPSWHRIGLASQLLSRYSTKTLLNFRANPTDVNAREHFDLNTLFINHPESVKQFANCYTQFPINLEKSDGYTVGATTQEHTDQLCEFYPNALIDIVAETFVNGNLFFATEKTVRPMLLKKPYIAMAGRDHLLYLRQMGFKTFHDFWNEDYDGYEGSDRYQKILDLIDVLANKSNNELIEIYYAMKPILDHNYNLLVNQTYGRKITRLV